MNRKLLDVNKQGMQNINIHQINQIITDETYGSAKSLLQHQKSEKAKIASANLTSKLNHLEKSQLQIAQNSLNSQLTQLRTTFTPSIYCVCDFDCFFAAVEMRENPSLKHRNVAVGGGGIVCASNYGARRFGIRSAMPLQVAKSLCSDLVVLPANNKLYAQVSRDSGAVFARFDPEFTMLSVDECVLDLTNFIKDSGQKQLRKDGHTNFIGGSDVWEWKIASVCDQIREAMQSSLGLTVSCGVGLSVQLAKINADRRKPNGQTVSRVKYASRDDMFQGISESISDLEIRKIWGIGQATAEMLSAKPFECVKIGDIQRKADVMMALLPKSIFMIIASAFGLGQIFGLGLDEGQELKSVGHARTFREMGDGFEQVIMDLCKDVCVRLEIQKLVPKRIQIQIRFADWSEQIRVKDLPYRSSALDVIYASAVQVFNEMFKGQTAMKRGKISTVGIGKNKQDVPSYFVRLIGVRAIEFDDIKNSNLGEFLTQKEVVSESSDFEVIGFIKGQKVVKEPQQKFGIDSFIKKVNK